MLLLTVEDKEVDDSGLTVENRNIDSAATTITTPPQKKKEQPRLLNSVIGC